MKEDMLNMLKKECIAEVEKNYEGQDKVVVFGEGNFDADIVLVGEAPGEKETKYVRPFVGQAGKNLDEFLEILELRREDIYITNTVKFRPFKVNPSTGRLSNRPPDKDEIKFCLPFLLRQIDIIEPKVIVTLGNTSLKAIMDNNKISIGEVHGATIDVKKYYIFPLYHPASIIYNVGLKEVYYEDLLKLKEFTGELIRKI
jgi:uracil-DNA glycosylase